MPPISRRFQLLPLTSPSSHAQASASVAAAAAATYRCCCGSLFYISNTRLKRRTPAIAISCLEENTLSRSPTATHACSFRQRHECSWPRCYEQLCRNRSVHKLQISNLNPLTCRLHLPLCVHCLSLSLSGCFLLVLQARAHGDLPALRWVCSV